MALSSASWYLRVCLVNDLVESDERALPQLPPVPVAAQTLMIDGYWNEDWSLSVVVVAGEAVVAAAVGVGVVVEAAAADGYVDFGVSAAAAGGDSVDACFVGAAAVAAGGGSAAVADDEFAAAVAAVVVEVAAVAGPGVLVASVLAAA